jgi:hypothetical protein
MEQKTGTKGFIILALIMSITGISFAIPQGSTYLLTDNYGGSWCDAEKSPTNSEDDLMCWAAAASNALEWTGWGKVGGMTNTDQMFSYFQDHWTDDGGLMVYGWDWWFDGSNPSQGWPGWSQVDVPGGDFHPSENFYDYYHSNSNDSQALSAIDQYLRAGYATTLGVYWNTNAQDDPLSGGHAITVWGFNYDSQDPTKIYGIWVTDSDDDKNLVNPDDTLRYYDVAYNNSTNKWYLQDFYGSNNTYIGVVQAIESIPEPATVLILALGSLATLRKRKFNK